MNPLSDSVVVQPSTQGPFPGPPFYPCQWRSSQKIVLRLRKYPITPPPPPPLPFFFSSPLLSLPSPPLPILPLLSPFVFLTPPVISFLSRRSKASFLTFFSMSLHLRYPGGLGPGRSPRVGLKPLVSSEFLYQSVGGYHVWVPPPSRPGLPPRPLSHVSLHPKNLGFVFVLSRSFTGRRTVTCKCPGYSNRWCDLRRTVP